MSETDWVSAYLEFLAYEKLIITLMFIVLCFLVGWTIGMSKKSRLHIH